MAFLAFDTSNYTSSVAVYDPDSGSMIQKKRLLDVAKGQRGLRQSEAVFQHTVNLAGLVPELFSLLNVETRIDAVGVSSRPRPVEGSYMPCFSVGRTNALAVSSALHVPFFETTHQHGHIAAALFGSGCVDLFERTFISFHLSGGTTEALLVSPCRTEIFDIRLIASSLDLKAGQLIDRTGVLLGMKFPAGAELDALSKKSDAVFRIKPTLKGADCCLSGVENKIRDMLSSGEPKENIAKYCFSYLISAIDGMLEKLLAEYGELPVVFSGGVSSNSMLRAFFERKYGAVFADSQFSADNAAGVAVIAAMKYKNGYPYCHTD